ncbi:phage tail protein [Bradyrhizobium sp. 2S1]|uniref:phage tail protein n=1 Tax=Bradyrhizobium sp. 2S1 TaxID=1404429 RepID=UPI00140E1234|nr:phage tail protein [Bradyrhizobium sp. 2S1]MCK7665031.1 phage tail protein [Bradyrhizobium sp. 2S1]
MTRRPTYHFVNVNHWAQALSATPGSTRLLDKSDGQRVRALPEKTKALAVAGREIWFIDDTDHLTVDGVCGPKVPDAEKLVVGPERVWLLAADTFMQFDRRTLQLLSKLPAGDAEAIAPDGKDGLWVLRGRRADHIDAAGRPLPPVDLGEPARDLARGNGTVMALTDKGLGLRQLGGDPPWELRFEEVLRDQPLGWRAFTGERLVSGEHLALVRGVWSRTNGGGEEKVPGGVIVAPDGSIVTSFEWHEGGEPALVVLDKADLLALFGDDLLRFAGTAAGGDIRLTPALITETLHGNWLYAEVNARLPEGATLTIRWAALKDQALIDTIKAIKANTALTAAQRIAEIGHLLKWHEVTYHGLPLAAAAAIKADPVPVECFSVSLHEAEHGSTIYVELRLEVQGSAGPAGIVALSVTHDANGLMAHLPAVYRGAGDADGTLRRVVSVLEATTQSIDERIADLARRLDPERADASRLPALAAMLGLPFDAALPPGMQQAVVKAAPEIFEHRGTRHGLEVLLNALFPKRPIRIVDRAARLLPVTLGGSPLPALLMGQAIRVPKLNARLVLGKTALCAASLGDDDGLIVPTAEVIVTIPATFYERRKLGAALRQMLEAMLPAGMRLKLRWSSWPAGIQPASDVLSVVDSPLDLRIGSGQPLGNARIGGRRDPRIAPDGIVPIAHRLL